jgi:hypothetical protein
MEQRVNHVPGPETDTRYLDSLLADREADGDMD